MSIIMLEQFDLEWPTNRLGNIDGEKHISSGRPRPSLKGVGPSVPQIFGTSYMRAHSMRTDNQILHSNRSRCEEKFHRVDHEYGLR